MSTQNFVPGSSAAPTTQVELSISAKNLKGSDLLSKSDPMCVTYTQPFGSHIWHECHRTERIMNCHDPEFTSKVVLPYLFEEQQPLKFEIYDVDSSSQRLQDHDFLGASICTLGQIVSSAKVKLPLQSHGSYDDKNAPQSWLIVSAEELFANNDEMVAEFSAQSLDKKDWFGKSDPFLEFYKTTESGDFIIVHKTEEVKNTLNPRWKKVMIPVKSLCNGDFDRTIKIKCWDWNSSGNHSLIGECVTNLRELTRNPPPSFQLIHPEKKSKKSSYNNSGTLRVDYMDILKVYSFMDYVKGGMNIHCTVAIDFTGSNGDPSHPSSLHYVCNTAMNCYEQAINSVVSIIEDYDTDKQFPVLGFGARLPPDGRVSHEFFVNMNPANPYCHKVSGVLEAYRSCIRQVQLYGPTNFAPVIDHVTRFAQSYNDGNNYFILLILTDGVISDMPQTTRAIVAASALPISIIIVGVGTADFGAMEMLDADRVPLEFGGIRAERDIVQFVPFSKFVSQGDPRTARIRLAKEVLAEIPGQVVGFMKARGYVPNAVRADPVNLPPNPELL